MNRKWLDKQKARAVRAYYRESGYGRETPSEYYIRKSELLSTVYTLEDSEMILEVMEGAPANWNTILTTQLYVTVMEFQSAIRFHEDTLMRLDGSIRRERYDRDDRERSTYTPRTHLAGAYPGMLPPKFPKDDSNISRRKSTPKDKGARPCRHCGSENHWDDECKYSYKVKKFARTNLVNTSSEERIAEQEYEDIYF
ncbi:hypothetical protein GALMADRAFT_60586, partial [Galerina marginata CBS 339.88]